MSFLGGREKSLKGAWVMCSVSGIARLRGPHLDQ
jgi:hypothetical protein